jgi:PPK2 family polyphosphate:nucleotide phosphotransferase
MFDAVESPYLVPFNGEFKLAAFNTRPAKENRAKKELKARLAELSQRLDDLQRVFYADNRYALLLIFQGMDASGKDGTVRAVLQNVNPAGCQVFSFKQPTDEEIDHDFLWRTSRRLPERGRIGVFNRSYYEEVLAVKVHPEYLEKQRLPPWANRETIWEDRYESIRQHEQHLVRNGIVVLKFWLNVSRAEQRRRFLARLDEPEKHWKFSVSDVKERMYWDSYMQAFESSLKATSRQWAPWYAIPADSKPYMRVCVADVLVRTLESLDLRVPKVDAPVMERFNEMRLLLDANSDK